MTLQAMRLSEARLNGSLRVGISALNTLDELKVFVAVLKEGLDAYASPVR